MVDLTPLLEMRGIHKRFPGVKALDNVDLDLGAGEVLALLGENGAGKSTLIKVLGGAHQPDAGTIRIEGRSIVMRNPQDARRAGVGLMYQEFNLVPSLTVRENIFLGQERTQLGFLRHRDENRHAADLLARLSMPLDPESRCGSLSVGQQQAVEIAKALGQRMKILVMDEPSAALTPQEVERLFVIIRDLKTRGIGVIYISHRLDEIFEIADRVMVMRDGTLVGSRPLSAVTRNELIEMMVGRSVQQEFPKQPAEIGEERLVVSGLTCGRRVRDVSFTVRRGEVLGLAGLVGAGRTETARLIFGADRLEAGSVTLDGKPLRIRCPRDAIRAGICLLTEDRKSQGLLLGRSVQENFALPSLARFSRLGWINQRRETDVFAEYVRNLRIKISGAEQRVRDLSGGNQQKIVLAKWLERHADILIFDEPTRGLDVGAKYEIYLLMNELARQGKGILMISSDLPEILGMSDRILVMHEGRVAGEIRDVAGATQQRVLELAVGGAK
jgi:ABC-type sugar transport system ATPase subunit